MLGVLVALLHDSGYMRRNSEGAMSRTARCSPRSTSAAARTSSPPTCRRVGFGAEAPLAARLVHFTGYEMEIEDIRVGDPRDRMLGCMVGTADLIGQMSDRMYLEKCREFLYREFVLGQDRARDACPTAARSCATPRPRT